MRNAISMYEMDEMANNRQQGLFAKKKDKNDKIRELLTSDGVDSGTIEKFIEWFGDNQQAWTVFKEISLKAKNANKKFGAKAIAEICRWQIEIEKNEEFKFNNNYISYLARLFNHNVQTEYFDTREVRGLKYAD